MYLRKRLSAVCLALTLALLAGPAVLADAKETRTFSADRLTVRNLIGAVTVKGHSGSDFEVTVHIQGRDSSDTLRVETREGSRAELNVVFPKAKNFVYPRLGSGSRTSFSIDDDNGWLSRLFGSGRVEVRGTGSGVEAWADLTILVPAGGEVEVLHGVGQVEADGINGDTELSTRSGSVRAKNIEGSLLVDTGSGHVEIAEIRGDLHVDTGSGHVEGHDIDGDRILVDTGSGHVELDRVRGRSLHVDTGSGRVRATSVSIEEANIDTGSGGVTLQLDEMGDGDFRIDTGSGGIDLVLPSGASGEFRAETGSGGVRVDLDDPIKVHRKDRDEMSFTLGGGGARIHLDTGSGGISISN